MRWVNKLFLVALLCSCSDSKQVDEVGGIERDEYLISIDGRYVGSLTVDTKCHAEPNNSCIFWEQSACISDSASLAPRCYERRLLHDDSIPNFRLIEQESNQDEQINDDNSTQPVENTVTLDLGLSVFLSVKDDVREEVRMKCGFSDSWRDLKAGILPEKALLVYLPVLIRSNSGQRYFLQISLEEPWSLNLIQLFENSVKGVALREDIFHLSPVSNLNALIKYCRKAYTDAPEGGFRDRYASSILDEVYSYELKKEINDNAYTEGTLSISMEAPK